MIGTYRVDGMTCGGCARSVTRAIVALEPRAKVEVDLERGVIRVEGCDDAKTIGQAVANAGFGFGGKVDD